jgi:hypothetical protein
LASRAGVEPATYGLEGRCSIQLSYREITYLDYDVGCNRSFISWSDNT